MICRYEQVKTSSALCAFLREGKKLTQKWRSHNVSDLNVPNTDPYLSPLFDCVRLCVLDVSERLRLYWILLFV